MRTSILGATFLLAGAGAALVAAAEPGGNGIALNGSDTLFDVTTSVLASCATQFSDFTANAITYQGGGSGVGAGAQGLGTQQIAPASRAYKNSEYCAIPGATAAGTESLMVGIDGLAILANQTNSCSSSAANGAGTNSAFAVTADGTAAGGAPATCPGCDASGNYTFTNSFDALKVLYFGLHHDSGNTYDCASPVRKTLIRQWKNLFTSDCVAGDATCAAGVTHAWRRSDLSGTTDAFVSVLNPPAKAGLSVGIGTLPTVPVGAAQKMNPFCNSSDATANPPTVSFGGSADFEDKDPVRTNCEDTVDGVCGPSKVGVLPLNFAGDLGVVLPVLMPDTASALASDFYPATACGSGCTLVAPIKGSLIPAGFKCPSGQNPTLGKCFMPYAGPSTAPDPRCISVSTNKCFGVVSKPDGRQYNKVVVVAKAQIPTASRATTPYQFAIDANGRLMNGSFFRIHAAAPSSTFVADASGGNPAGLCQENDDTSQIGCLTDSDPCSAGFAGREGARIYPGTGSPVAPVGAPLKALAVNGTPPFTPGADPDLAVKNLLQPAGTLPLYPLARRLYVTTIYGFGNLLGGEKELSACFANNSIVTPAVTGRFVPVPGGVQCLDYPEEKATTSSPAPNVQGSGNVALPGCNLGLVAHNACTDPLTAPGICGDGIVSTIFGEQCDPPNGTTCSTTCKNLP
jgi:hypothetical protein